MNTPEERPAGRTGIAKRVLIIQKGKTQKKVPPQMFGEHGWEFIYADRLETARRHSGEDRPYLHFIDTAYPEDEIREYVAHLRSQDAAHTVLAFSDEAGHPRARTLFRHGVYDCITTPFTPESLLPILERSHERVRLAKENARREKETEALEHAIASVILSTKRIAKHLSLAEFSRALMEELAALFGAAGGSFYLVEGRKLKRVYSLDPGHAPDEIELPLSEESFLGLAHKTGRPVLASDILREERAVPSGWPGYKHQSCLILPLFHNGEELVAFISLHDKKAEAFSHRDQTIGAALAAVSSGLLRSLRTLAESRERESRYEHFFKEGLAINFIARPDGRIDLANPAFYKILCADAPAAPRASIVPFFPKKRDWAALVRRLKREKRIDHLEIELVTRDNGRRLLFGNLIANMDEEGDLYSVSAAFFDVTQKRLLERELNHSLKMEAIGRLAGGVAHDFNNLITAILGSCEIMKDRITDPELAEEIDGIRAVGEKASVLTRQLLSLTRKQPQASSPLNLCRLVRELDRLLVRVLGEDIALVPSLPAAEPLIWADRGEIEQVIMNLVVNARDAMPEGGRIGIVVSEEDGGGPAGASGRYVVLRVSDQGRGMDAETLRHIFEPFFSTKGKGKGTGLGLSMVYSIVKRAGGFIDVKSAPQAGSTFSLFFPKAKKGQTEKADAPAASLPCAGTESILIVDDEKVVRLIMARILKKYGYRVSEAADGGEALALARREGALFDGAIIDIIMPSMSGVELAAELKKLSPALRVLFVSGYTAKEIGEHGGAGVREEDLITKPFHKEVLAQRVRQMLDRGKKKEPR